VLLLWLLRSLKLRAPDEIDKRVIVLVTGVLVDPIVRIPVVVLGGKHRGEQTTRDAPIPRVEILRAVVRRFGFLVLPTDQDRPRVSWDASRPAASSAQLDGSGLPPAQPTRASAPGLPPGDNTPPIKVARIRAYGADVVITGDRYADALDTSERYVAESQAMPIHAFDQTETLLGQGTLARELANQVPNAATVLVAAGGGGLIGGMATGYAGQKPRVIGVEPVGAPTLTEALKAGRPVDAPAGSIAADSLAPRRVGELMFPIAQQYVDRVVMVEDDDIVHAQDVLWDVFRLVVEPGGAAAFAALLAGQYNPSSDEHVVVARRRTASNGDPYADRRGRPTRVRRALRRGHLSPLRFAIRRHLRHAIFDPLPAIVAPHRFHARLLD
jgi:hypothetical protein